jgi:hypothetical protein
LTACGTGGCGILAADGGYDSPSLPGMIFLTVMRSNIVGDGLCGALDPDGPR